MMREPLTHAQLYARQYLVRSGMRTSISRPAGGFLAWYQTTVLAISLGIIFTNLPVYAYVLNQGLLPKFFFFSLFAFFAPLLILKSKALITYMVSPFALWASLMIVLNIVHYVTFSLDGNMGPLLVGYEQFEARTALILTRTQYVVFAWLLGFAAFASRRQSYQYLFTYLALLLPCAVIVDFIRPGIFYPLDTSGVVVGRAAAMYINPTMAGEALLLVFMFSCAATARKYRLPLYLLLGVGVLVTFSRSSIIAWLLLGPLLTVKRVLPRSAIFVMLAFLGVGLLSFGLFQSYLGQRHDLADAVVNLQARLNFFSSADFSDDSSRERAAVIKAGWELFLRSPLFGAGGGATQFWTTRASTHNQVLMLAAEYGLLGVGLWVWLVVVLWKGQFFQDRALQVALTLLFVFMSLFTHQMFDSASYWLATFALASIQRRKAAPRAGPTAAHHATYNAANIAGPYPGRPLP